jgi:hypothetical protein
LSTVYLLKKHYVKYEILPCIVLGVVAISSSECYGLATMREGVTR